MATARDIATRALKKSGVVGKGEIPADDDFEDAVSSLNEMMAAWKLRSVDITHVTLAADDTFPLASEYEEGTIYLLASRLSHDYALPVGFDADDWFRTFQAAYSSPPVATLPPAMRIMPSQTDRTGP